MKIRLIILVILFYCCKDTVKNTQSKKAQSNINYINKNDVNFDSDDFLKNFELLSIKEFKDYKIISKPANAIPNEFIVNKLMIPVNAIPYENSYIRTTYYKGVRAKLDNNSYLISILKTYDLHSYLDIMVYCE